MKFVFITFISLSIFCFSCHKKTSQPAGYGSSNSSQNDASSDFLYKYTSGTFNFQSAVHNINQTWPVALDSGCIYSYTKFPSNTSLLLLISNKKTNPTLVGNPDITLDLLQTGANSNYQINTTYSIPNSYRHCSIKCSGGFNYDATNVTCVFTSVNANKIEGYVDGKFDVYDANMAVTTSNIQGRLTFNILK